MHAPTAPSGRTAHSTVVLISAHLETLRGIYDKGGKQMPANAGLVMHSCVRKCGESVVKEAGLAQHGHLAPHARG
jgi:hypothetical protein